MNVISKIKYRKPSRKLSRNSNTNSNSNTSGSNSQGREKSPSDRLNESVFTDSLSHNLSIFENLLGENMDLHIRRFRIQMNAVTVSCGLVYLDVSSSKSDLNQILKALMLQIDESEQAGANLLDLVVSQCIPYSDVTLKQNVLDAANWLIDGNSLLFLDGFAEVIALSTKDFKERAIEQTPTEQTIQGAREGFIESIGTNISLIRKRMRSPDLRIRLIQIGKQTTTNVVYCYMKGIANEKLVQEVEQRLQLVETDALYGSGYLEQFIEDAPYSPFPQIQNTERPDKAVAAMLEGRVVLLVDGSPFALIVPAVFSQFYQTTEDYDTRFMMASMIRVIRLVSLLFSLIFPSLYVSLISFNPEMIPTKFAVAVAGGRAGVPFPAIAEIFGMELIMEILREATIRLPQQVGGALSIVGVLVIGQAAVQAGFVSPITVVIVALTTIGSFATPAYNAAIALRMLRFPLMIAAGVFGLYGVMIGLIIISNHLNSLESFGIPYLSPVVPENFQGLKDTVIRMPVWSMHKRPNELQPNNDTRVDVDQETLQANKGRPLTRMVGPSPEQQNQAKDNSSTQNDE